MHAQNPHATHAVGPDPHQVTRTLTHRLAPLPQTGPPSGPSAPPGRQWSPDPGADPYQDPDPYQSSAGGRTTDRVMDRTTDRVTGRVTDRTTGRVERRAPRSRKPDDGAGNRLLVLILFWSGLIASVALWWFDNPYGSVTGSAEVLTSVGRVTGMIGGYVLIVQVLMMSRAAWLEAWVGAHDLLRWHRRMGAFLLVMVLSHAVFIIAGYARADKVPVVEETVTMVTTFEDMISASIATGILVAVSLMAIRAIRRRIPYEVWHFLHLSGYLVLLLSYGHQFAAGAELATPGAAQWFWGGLYALVIASLFWGRLVEPVWFNLRHQLRVLDVVPESPDMFSVHVGGLRLDRMDVRPGQFFRWRFLSSKGWWQSHPFSLSAAPNGHSLRLTINEVGGHTNALRQLRPGTKVIAAGPSGTFTSDRRTKPGALLIAGGSGIAPIRALMEDMPPGTVVFYRARSAEELIFRYELERLARQRDLRLEYVLGSRRDPGPRYLQSPAGIKELVPDLARRDVYLCGPPGLISSMVKTLRKAGVRRRQIHLDPFEF